MKYSSFILKISLIILINREKDSFLILEKNMLKDC